MDLKKHKLVICILCVLAIICTSASIIVLQPTTATSSLNKVISTPTAQSAMQRVSRLVSVPSVYITMSGMPAVVSGRMSAYDIAVSEGRLAHFSQ